MLSRFANLSARMIAAGLEHDEQRDAARQALRGFLERIEIPPGDGLLRVVGNLGSMLSAAQGRPNRSRRRRSLLLMVAGAHIGLYRRLCWVAA